MCAGYKRSTPSMDSSRTIAIIPTCVPASADDVRANIARVSAFADAIHLDIDDGVFTPEPSWPFIENGKEEGIGEFDLPKDNFVIQVHLMVSGGRELHQRGENFIKAGARSIVVHVESIGGDADVLSAWRSLGAHEIGLAILLDTPLEDLSPLLPYCDFIHVLSVATIGAQGAPFDPRAIDRVKDLRSRFPDFPIQVDGGVSLDTVASLVEAGATRFSVGAAIAAALDRPRAYADLKSAAENALQ
jgi:ribulose-phosphate 3-epimerase